MIQLRRPLTLASTLVLVIACGGDEGGGSSGSDGLGETSGTGLTGAEDGGTSDGTAGTDSGSGDTGIDPEEGTYASDIAVADVEINQAVGVALVTAGQVVDASQRVAPLVSNRPAMIRVLWQTGAAFSPREVEARVTLEYPDGTRSVLTQTRTIDGPPRWDIKGGSFLWDVPAEDIVPGTEFSVGLFEVQDSGGAGDPGARVPTSGLADLAVPADPMVLKVVVVPATQGCTSNGPPALDTAIIESQLWNQWPINDLEIVYHDPITMNPSYCGDGNGILAELGTLRAQEALGPEWYYHAVFSSTEQDFMEDGGRSWLPGPEMGGDRVSYSVNWYGEALNNVAHEIGHSNGRPHTFEDGSYDPYAGDGAPCGRRTTYGYGVYPGEHPLYGDWDHAPMANVQGWLIHPTEGLGLTDFCEGHPDGAMGPALNDMMSYAAPYWVSAFTYRSLADRVRTLSAWGKEDLDAWRSSISIHEVWTKDGPVTFEAFGETAGDKITGDGEVGGRAFVHRRASP